MLIGFGAASPDVGSCPVFGSGSTPYCPFARAWWSPNDVYVFRFTTVCGAINTTSDALKFVSAYVASRDYDSGLQDIRGIVVNPVMLGSGVAQIEIVITTTESGTQVLKKPALAIAQEMMVATKCGIANAQYLQLLDKGAVGNWLTKSPVWTAQQAKNTGGDGRTQAFSDGQGVWIGGTAAAPQKQLAPRTDVPIAPPSPLDVLPSGMPLDFAKSVAGLNWPVVGIAAVAAVAGYYYWKGKK